MATKIAKDLIAGKLDPTNPEFLKEWQGKSFMYGGQKYTGKEGGFVAEKWDENIPNQKAVMFDPAKGLNPYWKGSFDTSE